MIFAICLIVLCAIYAFPIFTYVVERIIGRAQLNQSIPIWTLSVLGVMGIMASLDSINERMGFLAEDSYMFIVLALMIPAAFFVISYYSDKRRRLRIHTTPEPVDPPEDRPDALWSDADVWIDPWNPLGIRFIPVSVIEAGDAPADIEADMIRTLEKGGDDGIYYYTGTDNPTDMYVARFYWDYKEKTITDLNGEKWEVYHGNTDIRGVAGYNGENSDQYK